MFSFQHLIIFVIPAGSSVDALAKSKKTKNAKKPAKEEEVWVEALFHHQAANDRMMNAVMIVCLPVKFCFSAGGEEDPSGEGVHGEAGKEAEKAKEDLRHASWG